MLLKGPHPPRSRRGDRAPSAHAAATAHQGRPRGDRESPCAPTGSLPSRIPPLRVQSTSRESPSSLVIWLRGIGRARELLGRLLKHGVLVVYSSTARSPA